MGHAQPRFFHRPRGLRWLTLWGLRAFYRHAYGRARVVCTDVWLALRYRRPTRVWTPKCLFFSKLNETVYRCCAHIGTHTRPVWISRAPELFDKRVILCSSKHWRQGSVLLVRVLRIQTREVTDILIILFSTHFIRCVLIYANRFFFFFFNFGTFLYFTV